ncbi:glycosyltransferase [Marinomonas dokdonensis]|uniref:glycosyltransferase n=1 Tax=Marinomonas dokdonensis TaxID=328224 RepID=UPI0040556357
MKVSLIVAVYKDIEALDRIVEALKHQTYKNFELIVAEDNNAKEMKEYVESIQGLNVLHTHQEDQGIRKARSQNNAILAATGEYLIFIDGDCVPYTNFIENHVEISKRGTVLAGRRVNLGPKYSTQIRQQQLSSTSLEKQFFWRLPSLLIDGKENHIETGLSLNPKSSIFKRYVYPKSPSIVGCNFSCFKSDVIAINGFDESYGETSLPDDTDIEWRFRAYGLKVHSCKFAANQFHLHHSRSFREQIKNDFEDLMLSRKAKGLFKAHIGLDSH